MLTRRAGARVTAIILLSAMPRLLCGSVLAHECCHAFVRLSGFPRLELWVRFWVHSGAKSCTLHVRNESAAWLLRAASAAGSKRAVFLNRTRRLRRACVS